MAADGKLTPLRFISLPACSSAPNADFLFFLSIRTAPLNATVMSSCKIQVAFGARRTVLTEDRCPKQLLLRHDGRSFGQNASEVEDIEDAMDQLVQR